MENVKYYFLELLSPTSSPLPLPGELSPLVAGDPRRRVRHLLSDAPCLWVGLALLFCPLPHAPSPSV